MPPARKTRSKVAASKAELPPSVDPTHGHAGPTETLDTLVSTAPLPQKFEIWAALGQNEASLTVEDAARRWREGQELLSDGWKQDADEEGRLDDLRARKRRRVGTKLDDIQEGGAKADQELDVLWYSAGLRFPCSCEQPSWPHRYKPLHTPPIAKRLHALPPHPRPAQIPLVGSQLEEWASPILVELDPAVNEIEEFEHEWKRADGSWGRGWDFESTDTRKVALQRSQSPGTSAREQYKMVGKWKGKGRALDLPTRPEVVEVPVEDDPVARRVLNGQTTLIETIIPDQVKEVAPTWQEESKRRKAWWRKLIKEDEGSYGRFWDIIPLIPGQSKHPSINLSPGPSDFILPKALSSPDVRHPYHSELHRYVRRNLHGRVYWLIPVHGPVIVPGINDPGATTPSKHLPIPSPARLLQTAPTASSSESTTVSKNGPLIWSDLLLKHFFNGFLLPLYRDPTQPLGSIGIAISGAKPDPWIDLPARAPLNAHLHASAKEAAKSLSSRTSEMGPVTVECGDHIRIYCDAKHALALRTWLYGIEYDPSRLHRTEESSNVSVAKIRDRLKDGPSPTQSATQFASSGGRIKMFHKIRLSLVGSRQEVLIVA